MTWTWGSGHCSLRSEPAYTQSIPTATQIKTLKWARPTLSKLHLHLPSLSSVIEDTILLPHPKPAKVPRRLP